MHAEVFGSLRQLLLAPGSPAGSAINLIILALFLAGCVDNAAALVRLGRERRGLRRAKENLEAAAAAGALVPGAAVVDLLGVPPESLVGRRVGKILRLRSAGLRQSWILREITGDRLAGFGALARYIAAILTLLGLLGTVLGLSFALFNIQGALDQASDLAAFTGLVRALGQTLLGMRTAFACTLTGLATALLLSAFNHAVGRLQHRVAADLEELVTGELLPALERVDPGSDEAARAFAQLLVEAGRDLDRVREQVSTAATEYRQAGQQIATDVQALGAGVETLGRNVAEISASQRAVAESSRGTGEALHSLQTFLSELTAQHQESVARQLRASQDAYASGLDRHLQELQALVTQNREIVTGLAQAQSSALTAVSDLVLDVRSHLAATGAADTTRTLTATLEASHAALQDLRGLATRFEPAVLDGQQQFRSATEAALTEMRTAVTSLLGELARQQQSGMAVQVQSLQSALETALARHTEGQGSTLQMFSDVVSDLRSQIGPFFDRLSTPGNGRGSQPRAQALP